MANIADTVRQAQNGDSGAFEIIVDRFQDMAVGYAQASFLQAYLSLEDLTGPASCPSWFRRIVFKYCDRVTRRVQPQTTAIDDLVDILDSGDSPEVRLDTHRRRHWWTWIYQANTAP